MIELAIGFALGVAVRQFYKQIWTGVKKLFGKAEAGVAAKLSKPTAPKAPPASPAKP